MPCKYCLSESLKPAGSMRGKKLVKCISCGKRFIDNGNLPSMRVNKHAIVTAMSMYFEGLSARKVSRQLESIYGERVSQVTVWKWVRKYSTLVSEYVKTLSPQIGGKWHHDETVIRCEAQNQDSARAILDGNVVNYNFARPHMALKGKTPAEQAGIEVKGWKALIEGAIQQEVLAPQTQEGTAVAPLQVVRQ